MTVLIWYSMGSVFIEEYSADAEVFTDLLSDPEWTGATVVARYN
jgi:hypothetical protein